MTWMIYGANGYTGKLIVAKALAMGEQPVLAGRHPQRVMEMAREHGLAGRVFDLKNPRAAAKQLAGVSAVLHCAGPFSATAKPMLDACLEAGVHYLDITGEIDVFEMVQRRDSELKQRGIAAIPGVGFDVVPSDCLAAMLAARLPDAQELTLAFIPRAGQTSPGTAKTMVEGLVQGGKVRKDGVLTAVPASYKTRQIPFPGGTETAMTIPWGDVSTAYYSTRIPNIEVYLGMSKVQLTAARVTGSLKWLFAAPGMTAFLKKQVEKHVPGPTAEQRAKSTVELWGEAINAAGKRVEISIRTPDGYALTADAAVKATLRLIKAAPSGALTPSLAFGAEFVKELEGVHVLA